MIVDDIERPPAEYKMDIDRLNASADQEADTLAQLAEGIRRGDVVSASYVARVLERGAVIIRNRGSELDRLLRG